MRERLFRFKQFSVSHSASAMKVGTDGVTLGAWSSVTEGDSVLDVGAGCGLIGLMMAQRGAHRVTLLEIDPAAAKEAADNAAMSPWGGRIATICTDFLTYSPTEAFDRIVCNPPFFTNGEIAPDRQRAIARHEATLTIGSLCRHAASMLTPGGTLSMIIPADRADDATFEAGIAGLCCRRRTMLMTKPRSAPRRALLEFAHESGTEIRTELIIGTPPYLDITSPFYL